uniref:Uncharacterized protein n=1 Tax=Micrurus surinamensis TaxID=129470 RepID=A0A2D4PU72_MICSU
MCMGKKDGGGRSEAVSAGGKWEVVRVVEDAISSMGDETLGVEVECSVSLQNFAGASVPEIVQAVVSRLGSCLHQQTREIHHPLQLGTTSVQTDTIHLLLHSDCT